MWAHMKDYRTSTSSNDYSLHAQWRSHFSGAMKYQLDTYRGLALMDISLHINYKSHKTYYWIFQLTKS